MSDVLIKLYLDIMRIKSGSYLYLKISHHILFLLKRVDRSNISKKLNEEIKGYEKYLGASQG